MTRGPRTLLLLLAFLLVGQVAWSGAPVQREMGSHGEVYQLWAGSYGDIFPVGSETDPDNPVLALERQGPDGSVFLGLVPGTEDSEEESDPILVVEDSSEAVYLIWVTRHNVIHSRVKVIAFGSEGFSEHIDIGQSPFGIKSDPELTITRSQALIDGEDENQELAYDRTVLHLAWWEETGSGPEHIYSPVVLLNGTYVGRNILVDLASHMAGGDLTQDAPGVADNFYSVPWVFPGADPDTALVAFASPATGALYTARVRVLPIELVDLADRARAEIIFWAESVNQDSADRADLAERARAEIIFWARDMHASIQEFLADAIRALILEDPDEDIFQLAERARAEIIFWGATAWSSSLPQELLAASTWLEMGELGIPGVDTQVVEITPLTQRAVPPVEGDLFHVFLSPDGLHALAAWEAPDTLRYVVSDGPGWSEIQSLALGPSMDLASGLEMLERLIARR
jgi:hypothetical protein